MNSEHKGMGTMTVTIKDHDRLYVEFVMTMNNEQFDRYTKLPSQRRDYLFELWYKKNYEGKPLPEADNAARGIDLTNSVCGECGRDNGHYMFCATLPKNRH